MFKLTVVFFIFDTKPSVDAHVKYCVDKFNRALWSLTHLKRANMTNELLLEVYKIMLRPLLEYCNQIYHSMISKSMSDYVEKQQRRAFKIIYGFDEKYEDMLVKTGLKTMTERREEAFATFTKKLAESVRFGHLFPKNTTGTNMTLRNTNQYHEDFARSERLFRSPLFSMRRYLNAE